MKDLVARAELHDDAIRELDDAITFLENEWEGRGQLFAAAFNTTLERLLLHPRAGRTIGRRLRKWMMPRWKFVIIYTIEEYGIFIFAIAHHARRRNYWRSRLH